MFQLIRILVEKVIGQISYDTIVKRRREEKLANIGTDLMILYMSVNGVVVLGERILDVLRDMADAGRKEHRYSASRLKILLQYQVQQLLKVIASCGRLGAEIGIIDENGGRVLAKLLDIKVGLLSNQICELWPESLWNPGDGTNQLLGRKRGISFLRSFNKANIDTVLSLNDPEDWFERGRHESIEAWDSGVQIPLDDQCYSDIAQRFLDSGAEENLHAITACAQQLRQQIEKHFSIGDVLLKVRDPHGVQNDIALSENPARVLWDPFWWY